MKKIEKIDFQTSFFEATVPCPHERYKKKYFATLICLVKMKK